jgi:hypothetical protein
MAKVRLFGSEVGGERGILNGVILYVCSLTGIAVPRRFVCGRVII